MSERAQIRSGLVSAVLALGSNLGALLEHEQKNWESATFAGARHIITLEFKGEAAVEAGERLIDRLPEHEFALPGQLVADASVSAVDHALAPSPRLTVTCELLLLEDG